MEHKHNFRSWLNSRKRKIEARKWGHTDMARLIVCAPTFWDHCDGVDYFYVVEVANEQCQEEAS